MTNAELKQNILDDILSDDFMILQYSDYNFIANQYAEAIASQKDLEIKYIDSLSEVSDYLEGYGEDCSFLFILHTDTFDDLQQDYSIFINTIVICNKITAKVNKVVGSYVIKLDKIEPWALQEYVATKCPNLSRDNIEKLCYATQNNIYRVDNILEQLTLFDDGEDQNLILENLMNTIGTDLYYNTAFNLVDALLDPQNKSNVIADILLHRNCCDITPMFILTLLNNQLRNKAIICCGGKVSNTSFKGKDGKSMSPEYFRRIKNSFSYNPNNPASVNKFNKLNAQLNFLATVDSKIKLGQLELSDDYLLDYIITHIY